VTTSWPARSASCPSSACSRSRERNAATATHRSGTGQYSGRCCRRPLSSGGLEDEQGCWHDEMRRNGVGVRRCAVPGHQAGTGGGSRQRSWGRRIPRNLSSCRWKQSSSTRSADTTRGRPTGAEAGWTVAADS
jgi:hypothetical protein